MGVRLKSRQRNNDPVVELEFHGVAVFVDKDGGHNVVVFEDHYRAWNSLRIKSDIGLDIHPWLKPGDS